MIVVIVKIKFNSMLFPKTLTTSNPTLNSTFFPQKFINYNLQPHTQLAIRFSKWKAKYFCPVENFLKRVVVDLRRTGPLKSFYFTTSNPTLNSTFFPQSLTTVNPTLNSQSVFLSGKRSIFVPWRIF